MCIQIIPWTYLLVLYHFRERETVHVVKKQGQGTLGLELGNLPRSSVGDRQGTC